MLTVVGSCAADVNDAAQSTTTVTISTVAPTTLVPVATVAPNGETVKLQVIDNQFRPLQLTVKAGTEVLFQNKGRNNHNVLPVGDLTASSWGVQTDQFGPGASYAHVFTAPGTYQYYCSIHGVNGKGMVGIITVTAP